MKRSTVGIVVSSVIVLLGLLIGGGIYFMNAKKNEDIFIEVKLYGYDSLYFNIEPEEYHKVTIKTGKLENYKLFRSVHVFGMVGTTDQYVYTGMQIIYVDGIRMYIKYNAVKKYIVGDKPNKDNIVETEFTIPFVNKNQFDRRFQVV